MVKLCRPLGACHVVKSRFTCTFTHICYFYSRSTIHIYPSISISRITQKYSTPNPEENSQTHFPIPVIPCEINAPNILVTITCYIISRDECSKKKTKKYEEIKRGKCPEPRRKEKVRREVKMDKCPTVELGVQDTHLRGKKKKSISFSS